MVSIKPALGYLSRFPVPAEKNSKRYVTSRIKVMQEMGIPISPEEKEYLLSLKTEIAVDNRLRTFIVPEMPRGIV